MPQREFVNRIKERELLKNTIKIGNEFQIIFVTGTCGIGKTAFTKKVLSDNNYNDCIRVEINEFQGAIEQGLFVEKIAKSLNDYFCNKSQSFAYYFNNSVDDFLKKRAMSIIIESATAIFPQGSLLKTGIDMIFKQNNFDYNLFFNSGNNDILQTLRAYIEYVLSEKECIIVCENVQIIDSTSLTIIQEITKKSKGVFIFEYTVNKDFSIVKFEESYNNIFKNANISFFNLKKLNFIDYLKVLPQVGIEDLLEKSYMNFEGNLRQLFDAEVLITNNKNLDIVIREVENTNFNFTKVQIENLNSQLKMILCAIITHKSSVELDILHRFFMTAYFNGVWLNLNTSLAKLHEMNLIKQEFELISLGHDSIAHEIFADNHFQKYILISFSSWIETYKELLNNNDLYKYSKDRIYYQLFYFYCNYDPNYLLNLLPEIKSIAIRSLYPETAIRYIESLKTITVLSDRKEIVDYINFELIDIYYTLGIFDYAWNLLKEISINNNRKLVYTAMLLNRLDNHNEAINFITRSLEDSKSEHLNLILELILLLSYRSSSKNAKCLDVYEKIKQNRGYKKYDEYGVFLRNSEILLSIEDSKENAYKSISFFQERKLVINEGQSWLTLSVLHIWDGDLLNAEICLDKAEIILCNSTLERHIFLNNRAVIMMYSNIFSDKVENVLNEALKTTICSFDKISIYINFLILYTNWNKIKNTNKAESIIDEILDTITKEPDLVLHRLSYHTIAQYYKNYNIILYNKFVNMARCIHEKIYFKNDEYEEYWNERLFFIKSNRCDFLLKYDFELAVITYWHFVIPKLLD